MRRLTLFAVMIFIPALTAAAQENTRTYRDPSGTFTIRLSSNWKAQRESVDDAWNTLISSDSHVGKLAILTIGSAPAAGTSDAAKSRMLVGASQPYFQGWLNGLKEQARVEKTSKVYRTTIDSIDALRMDITYYRGDQNDPRRGYAIYLFGRSNTFFISLTGSEAGISALEKILATIKIEP